MTDLDADDWAKSYIENGGSHNGPYWSPENCDARAAAWDNYRLRHRQAPPAKCERVPLDRTDDSGAWLYTCRLHGGERTLLAECD